MHPIPGTITDPRLDSDQPIGSFATGQQLLALARSLATVVHAGQSRKGEGEPYINHVTRVAGRVLGWRAQTIAYLHDVIEDTAVTAEGLIDMGFPPSVVLDVVSLSRNGGETYSDFISRTIEKGSLDALQVKLADLRDNLTDPWATETKLAERYLPAARRITEEIERRKKG